MPNSTSASDNPSRERRPSALTRRQWLARCAAWTAGAAAVAVLALGFLATTGPGHTLLARLVSRVASAASGMQVRIEAVSGIVPFDCTVGRLAAADDHGVWLAVKDAHLAWSPLALLRGRVHIDGLSADIVRLRRPPVLPPRREPLRTDWPPRFPNLPPILVDRLAVGRIILDAPVAGQDAVVTLSGRLAESGQGAVALAIEARRLDAGGLTLHAAGSLHYAQWRLAAKLSLHDVAGGLLTAALAGDKAGPLDLTVTGDGPLDAWKGRLEASLGGAPLLAADCGLSVPLAASATASWSLDATLTPPPGFRADVAALAGARLTADLAGRVGIVSGALNLDKAEITAAAGRLSATAALDPDHDRFTAKARLDVADARRLSPGLAGRLTAGVDASGRLMRPDVTLFLGAQDFQAGAVSLKAADISGRLELAGDLGEVFPGAALTATGRLTGLAGPEGTTLLGPDLTLAVDANVDTQGAVTARDCSLSGQGGALALTGSLPGSGPAAGRLSLSMTDVAGAMSLLGLGLAGKGELAADFTADAAGNGQAVLSARFAGLAGTGTADAWSRVLATLLGATPTLAAKLDFSPAGGTVTGLSLTGRSATLSASGDYRTATDRLAASGRLEAPDLAVLGPALNLSLGGGLEADLQLTGPAAAPTLTAKGQLQKPLIGDAPLSGGDLDLTIRNLGGDPAGTLALALRRDGETARLETAYATTGARLALSNLRLTAPATAFSGEATLDTDNGKFSGRLSGNSDNLAGLGRFVGLPLAGSLKCTLTAAPGRAGQSLAVEASAANLRALGLAAASLSVSANLDDLTGLPRGKASLAAKELTAGDTTFASLSLTADGDGRALAANLAARGTVPGHLPLVLQAKADLAGQSAKYRASLASLSGSLGGRAFSLSGPATLAVGDGAIRIDGLNLAFDKARITASGSLGPRAAEGRLAAQHLPLALLALAGLPGVDGTAGLTAELSGAPAHPRVTAALHCDSVNLAGPKGQGLPAMAAKASLTLADGRLALTASLAGAGKDKNALAMELGLPARLSLSPFAWDLPQGGTLSGRITANADLATLAPILARFNSRLTGRLAGDIALSGTRAAPSMTGDVALAAERFENADAGLVLQNILLRLNVSNGVATIAKASGEDLKGGSFTMTGRFGLTGGNAPVDIVLTCHHLKAAGLDLAAATADGAVSVTGTLARMTARGTLAIGPAHVHLPSSLPPDVVVIPVTEINKPGSPAVAAKTAPPAAARSIDLDITVSLGESVHVQGLGLESRWGGKATIGGTAAAPAIRGKFAVKKGRVELFGSNLDITKGELVFSGETPPSPHLDIVASTTSGDVTAGVTLTGELANPSIELFSQPALPRDEILSRILFGQSASTLSPFQAAQLAQAAASLYSGGTPTNILARTRRVLGLDKLALVPGKGGFGTAALKAGKEIAKGVTVNVEQGLGAQSSAVSVEVQVTPNITVDSRVGADNKQGVGVNWKWDY